MKKNKAQRTFIPGDSWLYYKIYCGVNIADNILIDLIKPLTKYLFDKSLIFKWFFIKYSDPDPHLRVRFHITNKENIGEIIVKINELIGPFLNSHQIWDIQLATYQRELERYGTNTIEIAENYFFYDSESVLNHLKNFKDDESQFLNIINLVDTSLSLFNFDMERKISFLNTMQRKFKEEFEVNRSIRKKLSKKNNELEASMMNHKETSDFILLNRNQKQVEVNKLIDLEKENQLSISLENLLASFIHMSINRSFRSNQRLCEMMIYDFLYRKNRSINARYGQK